RHCRWGISSASLCARVAAAAARLDVGNAADGVHSPDPARAVGNRTNGESTNRPATRKRPRDRCRTARRSCPVPAHLSRGGLAPAEDLCAPSCPPRCVGPVQVCWVDLVLVGFRGLDWTAPAVGVPAIFGFPAPPGWTRPPRLTSRVR